MGKRKRQNARQQSGGRRGNRVAFALNTVSYIILIIGLSLILATTAILVANDMFALIKPEHTVVLELTEKLSVREMSTLLLEKEIINYRWSFELFSNMKKVDSFETGKFELHSSMDYGEIIGTLKRTIVSTQTVTIVIPEGYINAQIAQLLEDSFVCSKEEFLTTINTYPFKHEFLKDVPMEENRLEGYLFPDTYQFFINEKPVSVVNKMLNNFNNRITKEMREDLEEKEMTLAQVINVASLIEKEAKLNEERATIASVIYNRLNNPDYPFLEIDATILYAIGHKENLTQADLAINTPYNTYRYRGLPPTAICNPGIKSIAAAIAPESTKYYFYVANPTDGSHVFSKTLEEHLKAKAEMDALKNG